MCSLAGQTQSLDLLLDMGALKRVILQQQDLHLCQPLQPLLVPVMDPCQPVIREPIDAIALVHQLRQIVGTGV